MNKAKEQRYWLKSNFDVVDDKETDQGKKLPQPPLQKAVLEGAEIISLPEVNKDVVIKKDIFDCLMDRKATEYIQRTAFL